MYCLQLLICVCIYFIGHSKKKNNQKLMPQIIKVRLAYLQLQMLPI